MKKFISILLIIIILLFSITNVVLAGDPTTAMKGYQDQSNSAFLNNIGSKIYGIILIVGSAVALCVIAIMAIKFMTSGAEEKAQVKKNLIGFTIGVIILLCAVGLLSVLQRIGLQIGA